MITCICGKSFGKISFSKHKKICLEFRKSLKENTYFTCICGYMSFTQSGLISHQRRCVDWCKINKPDLIGDYKCICDKNFSLEVLLAHHQKKCKKYSAWETLQKEKDPDWVQRPTWVNKFLDILRSGRVWPNRYQIARDLGIGLDEFSKYYMRHPEMKAAVEDAESVAISVLERHCWGKACGLLKSGPQNGSDILAMFMLNAYRPDRYKHPLRREEITKPPSQVKITIVDKKKNA
jgi:hypothetical protein